MPVARQVGAADRSRPPRSPRSGRPPVEAKRGPPPGLYWRDAAQVERPGASGCRARQVGLRHRGRKLAACRPSGRDVAEVERQRREVSGVRIRREHSGRQGRVEPPRRHNVEHSSRSHGRRLRAAVRRHESLATPIPGSACPVDVDRLGLGAVAIRTDIGIDPADPVGGCGLRLDGRAARRSEQNQGQGPHAGAVRRIGWRFM